jgi:hypothetical protein
LIVSSLDCPFLIVSSLDCPFLIKNGQSREGTIKNEQSREAGNIRYTRHRTKANKNKKPYLDCPFLIVPSLDCPFLIAPSLDCPFLIVLDSMLFSIKFQIFLEARFFLIVMI